MTTQDFEKAQAALRTLEGMGLDVKSGWRGLTAKVEEYERGVPSEEDLRYSVPVEAPKMGQHFEGGGEPVVLEPHLMWKGYHYLLSPGQRRWFRENTGMTPSKTVTISWVETWPGTQHPRAFKVTSDTHVDPRHRKHVISEFVIRDAGKFFATAQMIDNEEQAPRQAVLTVNTLVLGGYYTLENVEKWAIEDLSGVKVSNRVQVTHIGERITFECQSGGKTFGNKATVDKDEFFRTVAESDKLYNPKKKGKNVSAPKVKFDDFLGDLEAELEG